MCQEFTGPIKPAGPETPWPSPARFPTLTPLVPPNLVGHKPGGCGPDQKQYLILLWGKKTPSLVSKETWLLEVDPNGQKLIFKEVNIPCSH